MSYTALYRKWRPLIFDDIVEQEHVVKTLKNSVSKGRISHAYLFSGTRGTGKTTTAHILARAVNCLNPVEGNPCNKCDICKGILSGSILDIIEIDAASNNSVDNIREIRDEVIYSPVSAKYKVYIIDEVHMLSMGAFNALLKTLEEPPAHVIFILATTEPHKLPVTVLSRCQKFEFRRISIDSIIKRLDIIARESDTVLKQDAARLIARLADGALRDAISLLDQCMLVGEREITYQDVISVTGLVREDMLSGIVDAIISKDTGNLLSYVDRFIMEGKDISRFLSDIVLYFRNLIVTLTVEKSTDIIECSPDLAKLMKKQCKSFTKDELITIIKELSSAELSLKNSSYPRVQLEVCLLKICEGINNVKNYATEKKDIEKKQIVKESLAEKYNTSDIKSHKLPVNNIDNIWNEVINYLKDMGKMKLFIYLTETKLVKTGEEQFSIVFNEKNKINMPIVKKDENLSAIKECLGKKLGCSVKLKCSDMPISEVIDVSSDENLIKKAQEMATKLNVPLNIIND